MIYRLILIVLLVSAGLFGQAERREQGNLVIEGIPEIPSRIEEKLFQYQNVRSASLQDWLGNNGIVITTRFGETSQIHIVDKPGAARRQITFFPEPVGGASVCPDPSVKGFLFSKDVGGGEFYQIYFYDLVTGNYKMLTDGKSRNEGLLWSRKGDKFSFGSTKRNGKDTDVYIADLNQPENAAAVVTEGGSWSPAQFSNDDTKLLVRKFVSANESYLYIYDLNTKKLEQVNPVEKTIAYGSAVWTGNDQGLYIVSNEDDEFQKLRYYDIKSKKFTVITKDIHWGVERVDISKDGSRLAFVVNEDGIGRMYIMDTKTNSYSLLKNVPSGQLGSMGFNETGTALAFTLSTPKYPADVYTVNLQDNQVERWTFSEVGGLDNEKFVDAELIHYPTFDMENGKQRTIPAFYYKPRKQGPHPVLISIHGGPEGQYTPGFNSFIQYLVNEMGIAVLAPNVRGSAGYGKTYLQMDNGFKREESVQDIGKLIEWIKTQPELDASGICVYGGSYGGYMVLASLMHFNDQLKCGIDVVGISNFVTFLENTQDYRRDLRRAEYGDERDPEMREYLESIAPAKHADKLNKPLFVIQGLNDPRVPVTESEQMVAEIRKSGGKVWYLMAKDEGHGFQKKVNRDYQLNAIVMFLEQNLLNSQVQ